MKEYKLIASLFIFTAGLIVGVQLFNISPNQFSSSTFSEQYNNTAAVLNAENSKLSPIIRDSYTLTQPHSFLIQPFINIIKGLDFGSSSQNVTVLQQFLNSIGYFPSSVAPTQYFGQITSNALKNFQKTNNLPQTGEVDSPTASAIENYFGGSFSSTMDFEPGEISTNQNVPGPEFDFGGVCTNYPPPGGYEHFGEQCNCMPTDIVANWQAVGEDESILGPGTCKGFGYRQRCDGSMYVGYFFNYCEDVL
ncbi:MAG: peptidoglycan-binding domain-containing protein [Patescibacteria group bacterium]